MFKLVGTEDHDIIDEKIIIDDNNKITKFGWKLMAIDIVADMCLFYLISKIVKMIRRK